jgi:hypothetical protein
MSQIYIFYFANGNTRSIFTCEAGTAGSTCGNRSDTEKMGEADGIGFRTIYREAKSGRGNGVPSPKHAGFQSPPEEGSLLKGGLPST